MEKREFKDFCKILAGLGEMFNKPISDTLYELYWEALKDISLEDCKRTANNLVLMAKFFPKPVEFREQVIPNLDAQASLAYDKVDKAFYSAGVYNSVAFDDPVIHAVIQSLGGWIKFCSLSDDELKWWRKDFEKLYKQYAPQVRKLDVPLSLPGQFELNNQTKGHEIKPPVLIGDNRKALEWREEVKALKASNQESVAKIALIS